MDFAKDDTGSLHGTFDIIICRNVMIYFQPEDNQRLIEAFHRSLRPGGWLFVAAPESSLVPRTLFKSDGPREAVCFRRISNQEESLGKIIPFPVQAPVFVPLKGLVFPNPPESLPASFLKSPSYKPLLSKAQKAFSEKLYDATKLAALETLKLLEKVDGCLDIRKEAYTLLIRSAGNTRHIDEALEYAKRLLALDKLDGESQRLKAYLLEDSGQIEEAIKAFERVLYLLPGDVMALLTLTLLFHRQKRSPQSIDRLLARCRRAISIREPHELLPGGEGMTGAAVEGLLRALEGQVRA